MDIKHIAAMFVDKVLNLNEDLKEQGIGLSILVSCFSDREAFNAYCLQYGLHKVRREINKLIRLKQLNFKVDFPCRGGKCWGVSLDFSPIII
jgi:hypothetical protein